MPMRVQVAIPEEFIDAPVLDSALEAVTRLNEALIDNGNAPLFSEAVNRVRWQAEPPGQEHFDHAAQVLQRGHGDCDDLAPWHAASLRATGQDPGATAIAYQSGPRRWHAVVQRSDGSLEDPSLSAGMPSHSGIRPAAIPLMDEAQNAVVGGYLLRPQIAIRPAYGEVQARADLPWHWRDHVMHDEPTETDWAMTALHQAPLASTALVGAIQGVLDLAQVNCVGSEEHLDRLEALQAAAEGWPYEDLAATWGEEHARAAVSVIGAFSRACQSTLYLPEWTEPWDPGAYHPKAHRAAAAAQPAASQNTASRGLPVPAVVTDAYGSWPLLPPDDPEYPELKEASDKHWANADSGDPGLIVNRGTVSERNARQYRFHRERGTDGKTYRVIRGPRAEHHTWDEWDALMEPKGWPRVKQLTAQMGNWYREQKAELEGTEWYETEGNAFTVKAPDGKHYLMQMEPSLNPDMLTLVMRGPKE